MPISVEQLQHKVEDLSNLPTLPGVVRFISTMVEDEKASVHDVSTIISRDQVLSAKILRLVNSPIYGFPGRISSVNHALVLLGFNVVKGLMLTTAVFESLAADARGLWDHSLGTALLSRRIAKERKMADPEEIMVAGLLHDLGKVILSYVVPEEHEKARKLAHERGCHIGEAEREVLGVDHARVASWVAWRWHLPERLTDVLTYHHSPSRAKHSRETAATVQLADILARGMGYGDAGDATMPPLDHEGFQLLGISYDQIDRVLSDAEQEYVTGVDIFRTGE